MSESPMSEAWSCSCTVLRGRQSQVGGTGWCESNRRRARRMLICGIVFRLLLAADEARGKANDRKFVAIELRSLGPLLRRKRSKGRDASAHFELGVEVRPCSAVERNQFFLSSASMAAFNSG